MKPKRYIIYLFTYTIIALGTAFFSTTGEVRPVFNGHWFIKTPFRFTDFGLLIVEVDGEKKVNPIYFDRAGNSLGKTWSFDRYNMAQKIGDAFLSGDEKQFDQSVAILKSQLNRKSNITFILQKRTFDPKDYIDSGNVLSAENLKSFVLEFP